VRINVHPGLQSAPPSGGSEPEKAEERAKAHELDEALTSLARRRVCAELAWRIYGQDAEEWGESEVGRGHFVDRALNLRAGGTVRDGVAYVSFRGTVGPFALSANWLKVNLCSRLTADAPRRHSGFDRAWGALRPQVVQWLESVRAQALVLTGHSMGAALALLAAHDLALEWPVQGVQVFAPPMVGAAEFNQDLLARLCANGHVADLMGYWMRTDAISIPLARMLGYAAPPNVVQVDERGLPDGVGKGRLAEISDTFGATTIVSISTTNGSALPARSVPGSIDRPVLGALQSTVVASSRWGWLVYAGLCVASVLRRAISYHAMNGYAISFGAIGGNWRPPQTWTRSP
jgi:hypothetical protein